MANTIAQLGLLAQAQGPDLESWTNLLVLLVMGALWLVGVLAKAMSKNRAARQNEQDDPAKRSSRPRATWQERLARKVEEIQRAAEAQNPEMARRAGQRSSSPAGGQQPPPVRAPGGKITIREGPRGESVMVYERPAPQPPAPPKPQPVRPPQPRPQPAVAVALPTPARAPLPVSPQRESVSPTKPGVAGLPSVTLEPSGTPEPPAPDTAKTESPYASPDVGLPVIIDYSDPDALRKAILHYEILGKPLAFRDLFE